MSRYYSFVLVSPEEISFPEHLFMLDPGVNVITLTVDDVEAFKTKLEEAGVKITQVNDLSAPGDDPRILGP
jgi:hypothetical protein